MARLLRHLHQDRVASLFDHRADGMLVKRVQGRMHVALMDEFAVEPDLHEVLHTKLDGICAKGGTVVVPERVLEFLAHKIVSNVRELEGALNRVVAYADLVGRPISLEMAEDVLSTGQAAQKLQEFVEFTQLMTANAGS